MPTKPKVERFSIGSVRFTDALWLRYALLIYTMDKEHPEGWTLTLRSRPRKETQAKLSVP